MRFITIIFSLIIISFSSTLHACEYSVGVVPQFEKRKIIRVWTPILKELSTRMQCQFTLSPTDTILQFEQEFKQGQFDLIYANPYHAIMAYDQQGYTPIIRSGSKKLEGILIVHKDSGITDLSQLQNAKIAFPSPNALGASLLMRAELKRKYGLTVHPVYVKTHSSVYLHVAKKLALAGGGVMRTLRKQKPALQSKLNILYKTTPVPAHPLAIHPRVDAFVSGEIQRHWLQMESYNPGIYDGIPMKGAITSSIKDYHILRELGLESFVGKKE